MATATGTITGMLDAPALHRLLAWSSPAYPIGGFAYSHGLEAAVEAALVTDRRSLIDYVETVLEAGAGRLDGALLAASWHAARDSDDTALAGLADLAAAWRGTAELALETLQQGSAFAAVTAAAWPDARYAAFVTRHPRRLPHPVAFGAAAGCHGVPLRPALAGYLAGFAANLVSAGVRLVPLGQTDGQVATATLAAAVDAAADAALTAQLDDLGSATPMLDIFSMHHETQYTRLFRS